MKRIVLLLFTAIIISCSSDNNHTKEDYTSEEYLHSIIVGSWQITHYREDDRGAWESAKLNQVYSFKEDYNFNYVSTLYDGTEQDYFEGNYDIIPATKIYNALLILHPIIEATPPIDASFEMILISHKNGVAEVYISNAKSYAKMEKIN